MARRILVFGVAAVIVAGLLLVLFWPDLLRTPPTQPVQAPQAKVKLAVLVVFDQMRGDYLERWQTHFGEGGFKRLQSEGAWYPDCHYPYGTTTTGPGHASILAGRTGATHGIINNNWYDRASGEDVYCSGSLRYELVPPRSKEDIAADIAKKKKPKPVGNPDRFLGQTLADVLKETNGGKSKVFGLSLKDRSAIMPTGRKPDGAYWFEGQFVTSTYYRDSLPAWVAEFNTNGTAQSFFGKPWTKLREELDYTAYSGPDDVKGEAKTAGRGTTFPHPITGGKEKPGSEYYESLANSPFGNELLLAFAKECIVREELGADDIPDLLTISFSSNDLIGHAYGPDSQEVMDVTLRSDLLMADLLKFLDEKVGSGKYSLVLTADHGVCPLPEVSASHGADADRIVPSKLLAAAEKFLQDTYGKLPEEPKTGDDTKKTNRWIEAASYPHLYLNHRLMGSKGVNPTEAAEKLAKFLTAQTGINRVFPRAELLGEPDAADDVAVKMKKSYHPDRGGDLVILTKPLWLLDTYTTGTTHGSPYPYDTHAAFLVFGPGITGGKHPEKVTPLHACPITADFLGIPRPEGCLIDVPTGLMAR